MQQLPLGVRLRDRATFETFEPGGQQQLLVHLRALAAGRRGVTWIWGPAGSGRTHLLQAVCTAAARAVRAGYLPLAELAAAGPAVLEGWSGIDVLCIDDLDTVAGRDAFDRALFSLYRDVEERGAGLLVAAAAPPAALPWALRDIGSRFGAAAVFQLHPLDDDGLLRALRLHATALGLELPEESARYLLRHQRRDIAALCRLLERLDVAALAAQRRLTVPFIRETLGEQP